MYGWIRLTGGVLALLSAGTGSPAPVGDEEPAPLTFALGDFDGDRITDVAVGLPEEGSGKLKQAGEVRLYSGKTGALLRRIQGTEAEEGYGDALATIGDIDKDGATDLAIGSAFRELDSGVDFVSGKTGKRIRTFALRSIGFGDEVCALEDGSRQREADVVVRNGVSGKWMYVNTSHPAFGATVTDAAGILSFTRLVGDVNGDGDSDFAVCAFAADVQGMKGAGRIRVLSGGGVGMSAGEKLDLLEIAGSRPHQGLGIVVGPGGDWNGDSRADILAGSGPPEADEKAGWCVRILSGKDGGEIWRLTPAEDEKGTLESALVPGDVTGDGVRDVVVSLSIEADKGPKVPATSSITLYSGADRSPVWTVKSTPGEILGVEFLLLRDVDGDSCPDVAVLSSGSALDGRRGKGIVRFLSGKTGALLRAFNPLETR